ncbi:hypothetical protein C8E08_4767 [Paracidovorax citrulli]|nr:hypothetical protein C8E08_4767 [Paracidovorax citrulli]REG68515.1 hypothetical protein C8E07_1625 [Paracidovorax citrulli]RLJ93072.1 hypothetical protein C8E06_1625 [Paracidovorax citrulli]SDK87535.1 hypothetical protein SAMN04489709_12539 [Paracidovorax citrulli]
MLTTTLTTTTMICPTIPQSPPFAGTGNTGSMLPIAWLGSYGWNVSTLFAFSDSLGTVSVCPAVKAPSPDTARLLASAMRHHRLASPSTLRAMSLSVSPPTTV